MPTIDLRDTETRNEWGLMTDTVSAPYQPPNRKQRQHSRAETEGMVLYALTICGPLTRLDLARMLGRAKTQHLIAIFEEMVAAGQLVRGFARQRNGKDAVIYGVEQSS